MNIELNEQEIEWLTFFIKQDYLSGQMYSETSKKIAQGIIKKLTEVQNEKHS